MVQPVSHVPARTVDPPPRAVPVVHPAGYYIAVVTKSARVCDGPYGSTIYRVEDMQWVPVESIPRPALTPSEQRDEAL